MEGSNVQQQVHEGLPKLSLMFWYCMPSNFILSYGDFIPTLNPAGFGEH